MSKVSAIAEHCRNHARILNQQLFGFEAAHGVPSCTNLGHIEFVVKWIVRIFVLLFKPVKRCLALSRVTRRFPNPYNDKSMRSEPADDAFAIFGLATASRSPNHNSVFLRIGKLFWVAKNCATIPTGSCLIDDFQLFLIFILAFSQENACRFWRFAGRRNLSRTA